MIFIFTGALIVGFAFYKLGSFAAIIAMITNAGKLAVVLMVVVAAVLLYRKFRKPVQMPRLPWLSDR